MTVALCTVGGYTAGAPLATWSVMKYYGVPVGFVELLCTFGYSFAATIPAAVRGSGTGGTSGAGRDGVIRAAAARPPLPAPPSSSA